MCVPVYVPEAVFVGIGLAARASYVKLKPFFLVFKSVIPVANVPERVPLLVANVEKFIVYGFPALFNVIEFDAGDAVTVIFPRGLTL